MVAEVVDMFGWLRALPGRRPKVGRDPAEVVERELRRTEAQRDRDRFNDEVLETDQHSVKGRWG